MLICLRSAGLLDQPENLEGRGKFVPPSQSTLGVQWVVSEWPWAQPVARTTPEPSIRGLGLTRHRLHGGRPAVGSLLFRPFQLYKRKLTLWSFMSSAPASPQNSLSRPSLSPVLGPLSNCQGTSFLREQTASTFRVPGHPQTREDFRRGGKNNFPSTFLHP